MSSPSGNSRGKLRHQSHNDLVIGITVTGCVIVIVTVLFLWYIIYRKVKTRRTSTYNFNSLKLQKFSYRKLKAATNGFSNRNKVGQGGFGAVYKGILRNGQQVAIKKLDTSSLQGEREFQNELMMIGSINSPHIVSLLGFCADSKRFMLVYEYMQNRSLQEALFDDDNPVILDWSTRFKIILNVARSLEFLHLNCDPPIIHGDVKPSNILLDASYCARLADFGLARLKTEVTEAEVRSENVEGNYLEQDRTHLERIARDKEKKLWPKVKRMKAEVLMQTENGEKECQVHGADENSNTHNTSLGTEAAPPSPGTVGSPLSCLEDSPTIGEDGKKCVVQISDDGQESAESYKDDSSVPHTPAPTEDLQIADSKAEIDLSMPLSSHAGEGEAEIGSKSSPVGERLDGNQLANPPGSGSGSSGQNEANDKCNCSRDWWWKQDGDEGIRDYTTNWLAGEVRQGQSDTQNWNWSEESPHDEQGKSSSKRKRWRERSMSLEWWVQLLRDMSCKSFTEKMLISKSKESNSGLLKENLSGDVSGDKSKELTKGDVVITEKRRESREWWREEYNDELNKKAKDSKKLNGKARKDVRTDSIVGEFRSFDLSGELNLQSRGAYERQRESSKYKEWWSGDLLNWPNRTRECTGIEFSGEISGPSKDSGMQEGRRVRSRSKDWWSGDISSRALSSTSSMRGTVCYVAPEYGGGGILTEKSDIYSFGVLILVIISGRRPLQVVATPAEFDRANLISWARNLAQTGNVLDLVDVALQGQYPKYEAYLCITLALLCLQRLPAVRPNMGEIVQILSGDLELPTFPFEFSPSPSSGNIALSLHSKVKPIGENQ